jgi:hypothetical protein
MGMVRSKLPSLPLARRRKQPTRLAGRRNDLVRRGAFAALPASARYAGIANFRMPITQEARASVKRDDGGFLGISLPSRTPRRKSSSTCWRSMSGTAGRAPIVDIINNAANREHSELTILASEIAAHSSAVPRLGGRGYGGTMPRRRTARRSEAGKARRENGV